MAKKIFLALIGIVLVIVGYAAMQPSTHTISREIAINAPAEKIFPYLNNMPLAEKWGPWKEIDPTTVMTYSGPEAGVGAHVAWKGGKQLGTGGGTIAESVPNERVLVKLEYTEPMHMQQDSFYLIRSEGGQSIVTWKATGDSPLIARIMCLFVDMDKQVGGMFEKGLQNLKRLVESGA